MFTSPDHRPLLLTSHVFILARDFLTDKHATPWRDNSHLKGARACAPANVSRIEDNLKRGADAAVALLVCTAPLRRVLMPNIPFQGATLSTSELRFFLHDAVRPFTMVFLSKLSFKCTTVKFAAVGSERLETMMALLLARVDGKGESEQVIDDVISTLKLLSSADGSALLPHLEQLRISEYGTKLRVSNQPFPFFFSALPQLSSLLLLDLDFSTLISREQLILIDGRAPNLRELRCCIGVASGFTTLFAPPPPPATTTTREFDDVSQQQQQQEEEEEEEVKLFINLRSLAVRFPHRAYAHEDSGNTMRGILFHILDSAILHQLTDEFSIGPPHGEYEDVSAFNRCAASAAAASLPLERLSHVKKMSGMFQVMSFAASPDFSALKSCCELGDHFCSRACFKDAAAAADGNVTVDLSGMVSLTRIRDNAFLECSHFGTTQSPLKFPPHLQHIGDGFCMGNVNMTSMSFDGADSLETIGAHFCEETGINALDFAPIAATLKHIDTTGFLSCSGIRSFDTAHLSGKMLGNEVGDNFLSGAVVLSRVDLIGLVGVTSIGNSFLSACRSLYTLTGGSGLSQVERVGSLFLGHTANLRECDCFEKMPSLREMGDRCLDCSAMAATGMAVLAAIVQKNTQL